MLQFYKLQCEIKNYKADNGSVMIHPTSVLDEGLQRFTHVYDDKTYLWVKLISNSKYNPDELNKEYAGEMELAVLDGKNEVVLKSATLNKIYDW